MELLLFLARVCGGILFFLPGVLLALLLFRDRSLFKRIVFSLALGSGIATIAGYTLAYFGKFSLWSSVLALVGISLALGIAHILHKRVHDKKLTVEWKTLIILTGCAVIGTVWRLFLISRSHVFGDAYGYPSSIIKQSIAASGSLNISVPDLHFYSGMVSGHAQYVGGEIAELLWQFVSFDYQPLVIFLGMVLYLGMVFIVIQRYTRRNDLAFTGVIILALGPIELWHSTLGFFGHELSYIALFSLFLLFERDEWPVFYFALIICTAAILSYYTAAVVVMISSAGFALASFLRDTEHSLRTALFRRRIFFFISLFLIAVVYVFLFSGTAAYTAQNVRAAASLAANPFINNSLTASTIPLPEQHYTGPFNFLGLPLIAYEDLLFLLLGLPFVAHYLFGKRQDHERIIFLALIPVLLIGIAFSIVHSYERAFYYLAFFSILALRIPKKYLVYVTLLLILSTLIFSELRQYQRPYLNINEQEIAASEFARHNLRGIIFTDQHFANVLILQKYYNVTGISDTDARNNALYYLHNSTQSDYALASLGADYIAITRRMRETYVLNLNLPQIAMTNEELYESYYHKIYDNGDVRIYELFSCTFPSFTGVRL